MSAAVTHHTQRGFSLPEVLMALVLAIMVVTALTGYYRVISLGLRVQWQYRQLWRLAGPQAETEPPPLPQGWQATRQETSTSGCVSISVNVTSPTGRHGQLSRLHCPPSQ